MTMHLHGPRATRSDLIREWQSKQAALDGSPTSPRRGRSAQELRTEPPVAAILATCAKPVHRLSRRRARFLRSKNCTAAGFPCLGTDSALGISGIEMPPRPPMAAEDLRILQPAPQNSNES